MKVVKHVLFSVHCVVDKCVCISIYYLAKPANLLFGMIIKAYFWEHK